VSLRVASPLKMKLPRLVAPIGVESVAVPTTQTVAVRTPATMTGAPRGSSTRSSRWPSVIPTPRAASTSAGSTLRIPSTVLRSIGSRL
jgi:hypothetical protein